MTVNGNGLLAALILGIGLGVGGEWVILHPRALPPETAAPAKRQADSSLVLERAPNPKAKPTSILPKGSTLEREVHVVVQPKAVIPADSTARLSELPSFLPPSGKVADSVTNVARETLSTFVADHPTALCPPVRVDLALVRMPDKTQRVIASSPDGTVLDSLSVDVPVAQPLPAPKVLAWGLGPRWGGGGARWGIGGTREAGPIRLSLDALQGPKNGGAMLVGGISIRF